ncbi:MAG: hypothetical protein EA382_04855 [Spirochaetaceae bacterium]|nr:MAG: hypothetical protein EA382_04855 [Spirochaetaceae bacterium]
MATIIPFPRNNAASTRSDASRFPRLMLKNLGLTDDQIETLSDGRHLERAKVFEVAPRLEPSDLDAAPVLSQTVALLIAIDSREPVRATAHGNLPVVIVKELFAGVFSDAEPDFVRVNREDDSMVLSRVRRLAQKAGLVWFRANAFGLTKPGRVALQSDDYAEIYRRLLEAHLRNPAAIDRFDRIPVGRAVAQTVPLLLFAARDTTGECLYEEDFSDLIWAVCDDQRAGSDDLDHAIHLRFFERFGVHFGLFQEGPTWKPPVEIPSRPFSSLARWRRTPLFDRVLRWHVDAPSCAVQRPEVAALNWMSRVHDSPYRLDGTEDYFARATCLRAMERCPTDADAYVVLARLYSRRPELALTIVDAGLLATAGAVPDVPDGLSVWADHTYRDVLRLRFVRADLLRDLGRLLDAFAQYEELLAIDPLDGIGAIEFYFQAAMEAGDYPRAQRALERCPDDRSTTGLWNATLVAFAHGDKERSERCRIDAMAANPNVPDKLLSNRLAEPPDYYSPGGLDEALIYADRFWRAWKRVPGARDWLRRRAAGGR